MGNTARYGWPYPEVTYSPNTSLHLKNAEQSIEVTVGSLADTVAGLPRGSIGPPTSLLSGTGLTTTDTIQPETFTGNVVAGRRYWVIHTRNEAFASVANNRTNRYRVAAGASVAVGSTQIGDPFVNGLAGGYNVFQFIAEWVATFTGQATFGVSSSVNTSTALVDSARARVLRVVDVGI